MNRDREGFSLKKLVLGPLSTNCYLLSCTKTKEAVIIDPAEASTVLLGIIDNNNLRLKYIINTHGHGDHIGGNRVLKEKYSAKLMIHKLDEDMLIDDKKNFSFYTGMPVQSPPPDEYLEDGINLKVGLLDLLVIHTPGHSPGSVSIKVNGIIFSGDTLFKDSIGRTDLPGGSLPVLMNSIKEKLFIFDSSYEVLPGHGPATTLKQELENNPWLEQE